MRISAGCWPARRAGSLSVKAEARTGCTRTRSAGAPRLAAVVPHRDHRPGQLLRSVAPLRLGPRGAGNGPAARAARGALHDRDPGHTHRGRGRVRRTAASRGTLICWGEPAYPSGLMAVDDAPPILTVLGRAELLGSPIVAMVGARNASANGRRFCRDLAAALGRGGIVVASGLARGIEAARLWGGPRPGASPRR